MVLCKECGKEFKQESTVFCRICKQVFCKNHGIYFNHNCKELKLDKQLMNSQPNDALVSLNIREEKIWFGSPLNDQVPLKKLEVDLIENLQNNPNDVDGWIWLGTINLDSNQFEKAISCFSKAITLKTTDLRGPFGFFTAILESKESRDQDFKRIVNICDIYISDTSEYKLFWYFKGLAYSKLGEYHKSIDCLRESLDISEDRGQKAWNIVRFTGSLENLQKAAWGNMGKLYGQLDDIKSAIDCLKEMIEIDLKDANSWYFLGMQYYRFNLFREAVETFEKAIQLDPSSERAWYSKGGSLSKMKQFQEALECFDQALLLNPSFVLALNDKGVIFNAMGQKLEAIKCYDKALMLNPKCWLCYFNKGNTFLQSNKALAALECYEKAIQINPEYADAWARKGLILQFLGNIKGALDCYEKTLQLAPTHPIALKGKKDLLSEWKI